MHLFLRTLLVLAGLPGAGGEVPRPSSAPAPRVFRCTPSTIEELEQATQGGKQAPVPKGPPQKVKNVIADALTRAKPGERIYLQPGDYAPFTIGFQSNSPANARTSGGQQGNPIVVEGSSDVRIIGSEGDTIAIDQRVPNGWITFRNLTIVPGQRAGIMFYQRGDGLLHQGYTFEDCHIIGAYDHEKDKGKRTKWGVWGQNLADFRFAGVRRPARIENISDEHAFYLQNVQGSITIENVHARDLGRTFCQFTARVHDGQPARGDVVVRRCVVEDACISKLDGYKGGAAFTICGRMDGAFVFERNVYQAGFRPNRQNLTMPGQPYGTGAFTAWEEGKAGQTATVVLRDNEFSFAPGCGDRPVVSIGGCTKVLILGENKFVSGGKQQALALDPVGPGGQPVSTPNGSIYLAPATKLEGQLSWLGRTPTPEQLAKLQKEAPQPPSGTGTPSGGG